jgi:hypothetical protein
MIAILAMQPAIGPAAILGAFVFVLSVAMDALAGLGDASNGQRGGRRGR